MKHFAVDIYPINGGEFFTTFIHPLTKKKVRSRFGSRQDALKYKEETEKKFNRPNIESFHELNVEELLNQYNIDKPENSFVKYSRVHLIDFVDTFGSYKLEELTTDVLKTWLDQVQRENNLKSISMRGMKCDIDGFFKYLVEKDVISESPLTTIYYEKSSPPLKSRNLLSSEEIKELLDVIKAFSPGYLYPLIRMFAETAGKTSEVTDLVWNDVDLEKGEVHFVQTTASRERTVKISNELVEMLKKKKATKGNVFLTYYGEPFTKNKIRRAILEFKAKGTFDRDWSPMDLRHSFAVDFLKNGGNVKNLQIILGHENIYQTKQLYGGDKTKLVRLV